MIQMSTRQTVEDNGLLSFLKNLLLSVHEGIVALCDRFDRRERSARGWGATCGVLFTLLHGMGWSFIIKNWDRFRSYLSGRGSCLSGSRYGKLLP